MYLDISNDGLEIRDRIKMVREHENVDLSQAGFGNKLSVERSAISLIERKRRNATERMIKDICREFNVNEDWLRFGIGDMFKSISEEDEIGEILTDLLVDVDDSVYKFIKSLLRTYKKLDDKSKEVIRNSTDLFIEELKKEG